MKWLPALTTVVLDPVPGLVMSFCAVVVDEEIMVLGGVVTRVVDSVGSIK